MGIKTIEIVNYRNINIELEERDNCCWWTTNLALDTPSFALGSQKNKEKAMEIAKKVIDVCLEPKS